MGLPWPRHSRYSDRPPMSTRPEKFPVTAGDAAPFGAGPSTVPTMASAVAMTNAKFRGRRSMPILWKHRADRLCVTGCFLGELHAGGEAEFGVDVGEVGLHSTG